jgi:hypothetical protein
LNAPASHARDAAARLLVWRAYRRDAEAYGRWLARAFGVGALVYLGLWAGVFALAAVQNLLLYRLGLSAAQTFGALGLAVLAASLSNVAARRVPPFWVSRLEADGLARAPLTAWQLVRFTLAAQVALGALATTLAVALLAFIVPAAAPGTLAARLVVVVLLVVALALHRLALHRAHLEGRSAALEATGLPALIVLDLVGLALAGTQPLFAALVAAALVAYGVVSGRATWRWLHAPTLSAGLTHKLHLKAALASGRFAGLVTGVPPGRADGALRRALNETPNAVRRSAGLLRALERGDVFVARGALELWRQGPGTWLFVAVNVAFFVLTCSLQTATFDPVAHVLLIITVSVLLARLYAGQALPAHFPVRVERQFFGELLPKAALLLAGYALCAVLGVAVGGTFITGLPLAALVHLAALYTLFRARTLLGVSEYAREGGLIAANLALLPLIVAKLFGVYDLVGWIYLAYAVLISFNPVPFVRGALVVVQRYVRP